MCGIAGAVSDTGIDPRALPAMADALSHRGPDGEGFLLHRPGRAPRVGRSVDEAAPEARGPVTAGFAHRRLTIIDLSEASDQPMLDPSGELAIAYNGELYNYVELRAELEALGRPAQTSGDTEVVLNAYAEWGPECLERMVGMWAFAILDLRRNSVFLAVDRFGIKPLFWTITGGTLHFASEIKAPARPPRRSSLSRTRTSSAGSCSPVRRTTPSGASSRASIGFAAAQAVSVPLDRPPAELRPHSLLVDSLRELRRIAAQCGPGGRRAGWPSRCASTSAATSRSAHA